MDIIIGGGISGLSAAWQLKRQGRPFLLLEASDRLGGWIGSIDDAPFPFALGPRTIRCQEGGKLLQLIQDVGLTLLPPKEGLTRYVFWNGKLHSLSLRSPLLKGVRRTLLKGLFKPVHAKDQSMASFFRDHFSSAVAERLGIPFLRGVFGQEGEELSLQSAFPWLAKGPLIRHLFGKKGQFLVLEGGVYSLVKRLSSLLKEEICLNEKVVSLSPNKVITSKREIVADRVISTLSLPQLAPLLPFKAPTLPYRSITSLHSFWEEKIESVKGFGYLVSPQEKGPVLGAIFDSEIQTAKGTAVTVMLSEEKDALTWGQKALEAHLGIKKTPDWHKVTVAKEAIPSYPVGWGETKKTFLEHLKRWDPQFVALGTSFFGPSVPELVCRN